MRVISIATRPAGPVPLNRCPCPMRARSRHKIHLQRRSSLIRRAPCRKSLPRFIGYDLGPTAKACLQYRSERGPIEVCGRCGGPVRVIACIEEQDVIPDKAGQALDRILSHLERKEQNTLPCHTSHHRPEHHLRQGELTRSIERGCPGYVAALRWEGLQHNSTPPAGKPVQTAWHEPLHARVQN